MKSFQDHNGMKTEISSRKKTGQFIKIKQHIPEQPIGKRNKKEK
jgi:hypothetical protein